MDMTGIGREVGQLYAVPAVCYRRVSGAYRVGWFFL